MNNESDNNTEDDLYYFETDHLALKGNKDYSEVIKTLFILCAQRKRAIEDYMKAVELKKEALEDPKKILEKIVNGESLGMPDMLRIPEIPVIDWSKYNVKIPEDNLKQIYSDTNIDFKKKHESPKKESKSSQGRWTLEEQKRLEELLHIYPPEQVEMRRFKKIADALGNRSVQQVTSRVQKYFLKLYKAGLPIPGRIPKSAERNRKGSLHKHQRHNHYLLKPTTFFPDLCLPVTPTDMDDSAGPSSHIQLPDECNQPSTSNYLMPAPYAEEQIDLSNKSDTELQLELMKRIKYEKSREDERVPFKHLGFKCDYCNEEPIVGVRWHCMTCQTDSIDFCTDCVFAQLYSDNPHPIRHLLTTCRDNDMDLSDSDSNGGSGQNPNSSDSESEDNDDELAASSQIKSENLNGVTDYKVQIKEDNDKTDHYNDLDNDLKLFCGDDISTELFGEIDGVAYDFLHAN